MPHCANSGCHDGSFEPDFRTIESSYNTLVYQPVIKNNPDGNYQFRVKAGNIDESVLYARLLSNSDGSATFDPNSQVMPLTAILFMTLIKNIFGIQKRKIIFQI